MNHLAEQGTISVRVSSKVHKQLKQYSDVTNVPISKVLEMALNDWMQVVGKVHIEVHKHNQARLRELAQIEDDANNVVPIKFGLVGAL